MPKTPRAHFVLAALLCASALRPASAAEDPRLAGARTLLNEGLARLDAGDYAAAHDRFRRAYETYPSPKILLNLGETARVLGRDVEAAQAYDTFLSQASSMPEMTAERVGMARDGLSAVLRKVGRIRLELSPSDAAVKVGSRAVEPGRHRGLIYVAPGSHKVTAAAVGHLAKSSAVNVRAGAEIRVAMELERDASLRLGADGRGRSRLTGAKYTWIAAGAAAALLATGAVLAWRANAHWNEYQTTTRPERWLELRSAIRTESTLTNVAFAGAGAAALATGILYYLETRRDPTEARKGSRLRAHLSLGEDAIGGGVRLMF